jgi:hypothetical protein
MTALEWFVKQIIDGTMPIEYIIQKAKEMEKEQITLSHINGQSEFDTLKYRDYNKELANAYYNLTFKSE